jgi:hypothetical protein
VKERFALWVYVPSWRLNRSPAAAFENAVAKLLGVELLKESE